MATYTPPTKLEDLYRNPSKALPREILNSGFTLTEEVLTQYQQFMDDAVRRHSRAYLKYPGLIKQGPPLYVSTTNKSFDLLGHQGLGDAILLGGVHNGPNNVPTLVDTTENFITKGIVADMEVQNITDGSKATITVVGTSLLAGTLSGGIQDDWDTGDEYHVIKYPTTVLVPEIMKTERFVINSGVAYDAYGNRLTLNDRITIDLNIDYTGDGFNQDGTTYYGYLCMRKRNDYRPIDFIDHPLYGVPGATKRITDIEFYMSPGVFEAANVALASGKQSAGVNLPVLMDTTRTLGVNDFKTMGIVPGMYAHNLTDSSLGSITTVTEFVITATMSDGITNSWNVGDEYHITNGIQNGFLYYPPVDDLGKIEGIVIAKVFADAAAAPDMDLKTNLLAVKDGTPQDIPGFVEISPAI